MITEENGIKTYHGDTFKIVMLRYSDPDRLSLAESASVYVNKQDRNNIQRPLNIIRNRHSLEIFRGEHVKFDFLDVSHEVYDHLVTYTTRQMRAAGGSRANEITDFTMPSDNVKNEKSIEMLMQNTIDNYKVLLNKRESKQVARAVAPMNHRMKRFIIQFNFQTLIEAFMPQRLWNKGAQGNTVKVVQGMWELIHSVDPELWETAYEYHGQHVSEWLYVLRYIRENGITLTELYGFMQMRDMKITERIDKALIELFPQPKGMWE